VVTQTFPCPVCVDRDTLLSHYWSESGLLENERAWRTEHCRNIAGKGNAIDAVNGLLSTLPMPRGWVLLYGSYGVGKSGLLKAAVAASIRAGTRARYLRAADLLGEIRSTYGDQDGEVDEEALRQVYGTYPVLALDEIDRIPDTSWSRSMLFAILDERHRRIDKGATLMATNAQPDQMPGFEYLVSRMASGEMVLMAGEDLRRGE
jgi:DNA replication protein DnaC